MSLVGGEDAGRGGVLRRGARNQIVWATLMLGWSLSGRLTSAMELGVREFAVQSTPHTVLLQRGFYCETLQPLLTRWALLWLRRHRLLRGSDEVLIAYMSRQAPSSADEAAAAAARWDTLVTDLAEEHMQLLNLAHSWLHFVLPFVLGKVGLRTHLRD
eukprot:3071594-Pleurochrysis_carterae.AAC.4